MVDARAAAQVIDSSRRPRWLHVDPACRL